MVNNKKAQNQVIIIKGGPGFNETDEHGLKRLFRKLNKWARCPKPGCNGFLFRKNKKTFKCRKCGLEKPATPPPEW